MERFAQLWAREHGYAFKVKSSHPEKNTYLKCDRAGEYSGPLVTERQRQTSTLLCGCQCEVKGVCPQVPKKQLKQPGFVAPRILWTLETRVPSHNHEPSSTPSAHPVLRRLNSSQQEEVNRLTKSHVSPIQILHQLRTSDPNCLATTRTIYNARAALRKQALDGRTQIEALLDTLKEYNWTHKANVDDKGALRDLFFAHPGSLHLARINHHVCLIDATYRTNKYHLPLLHIVGQSCTNKLFSVAFCFLSSETDKAYLWAIEQLKDIWHPERQPQVFITDKEKALHNALKVHFPDSSLNLCGWHINQNITTNCKKYFSGPLKDKWSDFNSLWQAVTSSKTVDDYEEILDQLFEFLGDLTNVKDYLSKNVLPFKERFMTPWAGHTLHLGTVNSHFVLSSFF